MSSADKPSSDRLVGGIFLAVIFGGPVLMLAFMVLDLAVCGSGCSDR